MPDNRQHRGPHPKDNELFAHEQLPALCNAVADYSLLLSKGYSENAALKLVGDHFGLRQRQRMAVARSSCTDQHYLERQRKRASLSSVSSLEIDGFNLLITVEAALAGGFIIIGRDGAARDVASLHGSFRSVEETEPALTLIGHHLQAIKNVLWLLDRPVSNSGRLRQLMTDLAAKHQWNWSVELVQNPDDNLKHTTATIVTADSIILNSCSAWVNMAAEIIESSIPQARVINLRTQSLRTAPSNA